MPVVTVRGPKGKVGSIGCATGWRNKSNVSSDVGVDVDGWLLWLDVCGVVGVHCDLAACSTRVCVG